jgi:hypothetical protein
MVHALHIVVAWKEWSVMRTRYLPLALLLGLGLAGLAGLPAAEKADQEKIAKLINQLGSNDFAEREQATRDLEAVGAPALDALRQAARSDDMEIKRRAGELVAKLEKLAETDRILAPSKVHLVYKDTPLREAIEDLKKKTGANIVLNDPENKLAERKVTLDTGDTTFWEAFDQFCKKAGLVEQNPAQVGVQPPIKGVPVPPPPAPPAKPGAGQGAAAAPAAAPVQVVQVQAAPAQAQVQVQIQIGAGGAAPPVQPLPPIGSRPFMPYAGINQITLADGKPEERPTCYAGSVRIRALPPGTAVPGVPKREGEMVVALQVSPEPKLQWQNLVGVRVEKAVDDKDQSLIQAVAAADGDDAPNPIGVVKPAVAMRIRPPMMMGWQEVPVRLKKGDKESKSLKEIKGTVSAQIRTAPEAMMTVDKILKASGQTVKGDKGGYIKVIDVTQGDDGEIKLHVQFETPPDVAPAVNAPVPVPLPAPAPGGAAPGVRPVPMPFVPAGINGLVLQDDKGQALPLTVAEGQAQNNGTTVIWEYKFTCKPQKDQGVPAKLVFNGTRTVTVDIAFTLKDVPLQ